MLQDFICQRITDNLPFAPTDEQQQLISQLSSFIVATDRRKTFILKGYAGTGKTSIVSSLVKTLQQFQQQFVLLAPTGRAAKVFASYANAQASSIHKKIYRQKSITDFTFSLNQNLHKNTLFIVDEASMIYTSAADKTFGSGNLLEDLITFVFADPSNALILLGDDAQLTPITQRQTPALNADEMFQFGLSIQNFQLQQVTRQSQTSGILFNATYLRNCIAEQNTLQKPIFQLNQPDIQRISGNELIEKLTNCYDKDGVEETVIITRSNKLANIYNRGIRAQVLQNESEIANNDLIIVTKNNYFWGERQQTPTLIANGDIGYIKRIRKHQQLYGFHFAEATLTFDGIEGEIDAKILLDALYCDTAEATNELNIRLREAILEDYADITRKTERYHALRKNEYYNALQIKFAYAITCHKAQGGQWTNVFVEQGYISDEAVDTDYYRWLYTAFTRSKEKLYLINFPDKHFTK